MNFLKSKPGKNTVQKKSLQAFVCYVSVCFCNDIETLFYF